MSPNANHKTGQLNTYDNFRTKIARNRADRPLNETDLWIFAWDCGMMKKGTNKTEIDFWERTWKESSLEGYYKIEKYLVINKKLDKLFKKFLDKGEKKILEIGCAKGKQLIYFAREFGYDIYGVDYSLKGVELAEQNLNLAGVNGIILCEDIFRTSLKEESFDIVYSMGLIEHFENPEEIIDIHIKLLKKGGTFIISMPNFKDSLYFTLNRLLGNDRTLLETHNLSIIDKKALSELLQDKEIKISMLDYFGPIDLSLVFSSMKGKPMLYLARLANQFIGYITFFMPKSRYFSPYLVLVGQKNKDITASP